ncbi:hypothetical protein BH11PSE12_BH11PSE12_01830 [soil metagenome]
MNIPHRQLIIFFALLANISAPSSIAHSEAYKCVNKGITSYGQYPCTEGVSTAVELGEKTVSSSEYLHALTLAAIEKKEAKTLSHHRHKTEERYNQEMNSIAAKNEKIKQKCTELQTTVKWAKEDLQNVTLKTERKLKLKLKRATEKAALICKA